MPPVPLVAATELVPEDPPVALPLLAEPVGVGFDASPDGASEHCTRRIAPPRTLKIVNRDVMARIGFGMAGRATRENSRTAYGAPAVR